MNTPVLHVTAALLASRRLSLPLPRAARCRAPGRLRLVRTPSGRDPLSLDLMPLASVRAAPWPALRAVSVLALACAAAAACAPARARPAAGPGRGAAPAVESLPELRAEIARRVAADSAVQAQLGARIQAGQPIGPADYAPRDSVFGENLGRMRVLLATYGWPGYRLVGEEGSHGAWLLLQHADRDTALQRLALTRLERAVRARDASARDLAYLTDRVRVAEGRPQVYGTQLDYDDRGCASPKPSEDPARLDARRAAAGLEPVAAYLERAMTAMGRAAPCRPRPAPR